MILLYLVYTDTQSMKNSVSTKYFNRIVCFREIPQITENFTNLRARISGKVCRKVITLHEFYVQYSYRWRNGVGLFSFSHDTKDSLNTLF